MAQKINPVLVQLTNQLADITNLETFAFFGGAVLDTILKRPIADYDICFESDSGYEQLTGILERLREQKFNIITPARSYPIWLDQEAFVGVAKKDQWLLDIAALPSYTYMRFFTVDSMYVHYPEMQIVDKYDALGAYRRQEIKLARRIDQENPYRIATRAIRIGAKYGFPLTNAGSLWDELIPCLHDWQPDSEFQGPFAYAEAAAKTLRAIARSKDQSHFVEELLQTKILTELFPELTAPLTLLQEKGQLQRQVTSDHELIERLLLLPLAASDRQALVTRLEATRDYGI